MSDLLLMGSSGLPRNGLVGLWDPYRDAYGLAEEARLALQTGVDYSGHGNSLTYGATTGASTDDPVNTGTAWSFDGDDYATAGRPAQLEVAQPFCGYVVAKAGADGSIMTMLGKNNSLVGGASYTGFWLFRHSTANYIGLRLMGPIAYNVNTNSTFAFTAAAGYRGIFFGWDGTSLHLRAGSVAPTPVSGAWVPNTTQNLTIGKNAAAADYFWTGDIAYVSMWAGVCWPTAVSTRIHNYSKSLFAGRGLTVA